jgi:predicted HTH domain antitoxin
MSVTLEIPDDFPQRLQNEPKAAEAQLRLELAIAYYRQGKLPPGRAAEIAGITRCEFEDVLRRREIPMPYSLSDLEHDIAYASGSRQP